MRSAELGAGGHERLRLAQRGAGVFPAGIRPAGSTAEAPHRHRPETGPGPFSSRAVIVAFASRSRCLGVTSVRVVQELQDLGTRARSRVETLR
ncbi:hypothetical protein [Actinomadura sp. DC4]|uniref:hypothetical protein n=1 Tax=Actinomadura sp. DC4 TaxID=3055069 RepID=UPI0025B09300|nr:hypothetical protein [Actinomadura sp. DC4]MDN3355370.1 hypothetical protein [Actinomadura sp. DC4]